MKSEDSGLVRRCRKIVIYYLRIPAPKRKRVLTWKVSGDRGKYWFLSSACRRGKEKLRSPSIRFGFRTKQTFKVNWHSLFPITWQRWLFNGILQSLVLARFQSKKQSENDSKLLEGLEKNRIAHMNLLPTYQLVLSVRRKQPTTSTCRSTQSQLFQFGKIKRYSFLYQ